MFDSGLLRSGVLGSKDQRVLEKQNQDIRVSTNMEGTYQVLTLVISHCNFSLLTYVIYPNKLVCFDVDPEA